MNTLEQAKDYNAIVRAIIAGDCDEQLEQLADLVSQRRKIVAANFAIRLAPGDLVRFVETIRPGYLAGRTARFVRIEGNKVVVSCPHSNGYGRFSGCQELRCGLTLIEAI